MSSRKRMTKRRGGVALVVLSTLLISCGGDGDASVDSVPPTSAAAETTAPPTTAAPPTTTTTEPPQLIGTPAFDESSKVSTVGIDRLAFGMSVDEAERELGTDLVDVDEVRDPDCYQVRPTGGPAGVELTVTLGTIERVDISTEIITTRSGAGLGLTEDELFALFPNNLTSQPGESGGTTVVFTPSDAGDAAFRVIFETDGTVVTSFRSGRVPQIEPQFPCLSG